jgi:hypothetical protein
VKFDIDDVSEGMPRNANCGLKPDKKRSWQLTHIPKDIVASDNHLLK